MAKEAGIANTPDRKALPRAQPHELRAASLLFPCGTSLSLDGFHPRHFALLSDGLLTALGAIIEAMEAIGVPPQQIAWLVFAMLEKPKRG